VEPLKASSLMVGLQTCPKLFDQANTLAYYDKAKISTLTSFTVERENAEKLFPKSIASTTGSVTSIISDIFTKKT
jgi:hypothetical protein